MPMYFSSGSQVKAPFAIASIGRQWDQNPIQRPLGYPDYHYLQTEEGCGRIEVQGEPYILHQDEGILLAPGISHAYWSVTEHWMTTFFTVSGTMETSIDILLDNRKMILTRKEQGKRIRRLITDAVEKYENPPADAKALSVDCYRLLMEFVEGISAESFTEDPLYRQYVVPVIKEIETSYDTRLTIPELSRSVYITPQYLSRLFRRFLGCSAYEYLMTYRISRAKELLLGRSGMGVADIAHLVGFEEPSHFIAMFKKSVGMTPLAFRNLYR